MKKWIGRALAFFVIMSVALNLTGCAALKKKLTPKKKPKPKHTVFSKVRKYDIRPSPELYEKHYIYWINWHKKFISELGESHKSDVRSLEEMTSNLGDMFALLRDEKADKLKSHIDKLRDLKALIQKRSARGSNDIRIRRIAEKEQRAIRREFSPRQAADYIRKDWRQTTEND